MRVPAVGDKVAFSRAFLRSTGQFTGPEAPASYGPFARGEVHEHIPPYVWIRWADGQETRVNPHNLVCVDELHKEPT